MLGARNGDAPCACNGIGYMHARERARTSDEFGILKVVHVCRVRERSEVLRARRLVGLVVVWHAHRRLPARQPPLAAHSERVHQVRTQAELRRRIAAAVAALVLWSALDTS